MSLEYLLFSLEFSTSFAKDKTYGSDSKVYEGTFEDKGESYSVVINRVENLEDKKSEED